MELRINNNLDANKWDAFILNHPDGNILQSWDWGKFQEFLGHQIWRFEVVDNNQTISQLLVIKLSLGFGKNILYAPRDILINKGHSAHYQIEAIKLILEKVKKIGLKENAILFRIEPTILKKDITTLSIYHSLGFKQSKKTLQPSENWLIDISDEEKMLAQMKPKTRYNIRIAEREKIRIITSTNLDDINTFNSLNKETSRRGKFKSHSDNYYKKQLETLGGKLQLHFAYYNNIPLAAILVSYFGSTATYLHGASSHQYKDKMASYLLHWEIIKKAKEKGITIYDMGGIDQSGEKPAWAGITRFKKGFGGKAIEYIGALEFPLNSTWFKFYKLINMLRK